MKDKILATCALLAMLLVAGTGFGTLESEAIAVPRDECAANDCPDEGTVVCITVLTEQGTIICHRPS